MNTVFKYLLQFKDFQRIEMPFNAQILCAQMQGNNCKLWALVNKDEMKKELRGC